MRLPVSFYHLRTNDGREIDLVIEREDGFFVFEIKQTGHVHSSDFRHLRGLEGLFDKPLLLGAVISEDTTVAPYDGAATRLWSLPASMLLGC